MKKSLLFYLLLCVTLSCSISSSEDCKDSCLPITTRSNEPSNDGYERFLVSDDDLEAYIHFLNTIVDSERGLVVEAIPVEHDGHIVYFIINLEQGWLLLSADKRGPMILAESDSGSFSLNETNEGVISWLDGLVDDIEYRWYYEDEYYAHNGEYAKEYEDYCLNEWRAINAETAFIIENRLQTKVNDGPIIIFDPQGHFELAYTYYTHHSYQHVQHLMTTKWNQDPPFNDYIPYVDGSTTERCPAGCVMIAASQVLYYLHNYMGSPLTSPTSGYCYGDENGYSMGFGNVSDTT